MTVSAGVLRAPVSSTFYSFLLVFPPGLSSWSFLLVFRLHLIFTDYWLPISAPEFQSLNHSSLSNWADLNCFSALPEWGPRVLMGP